MENFFENAFKNMDSESRESFYKTVFMNDDSEYAAKLRIEYYKTQFKSMGENVTIGKGVNIINPQFITVGDNVSIGDNCTLIARGEKGITLSYTPDLLPLLAEKSYSLKFGARNLRRFIQSEIEDRAAELIISNYTQNIKNILISTENGEIKVEKA
jgi:acetyltransferase-like isoleucine patch superfamily enzyme